MTTNDGNRETGGQVPVSDKMEYVISSKWQGNPDTLQKRGYIICLRGEGVGLRQIYDWMVCLKNYYGEYDVEELGRLLKKFGLMGPWVCFSGILVDYLGLSEVSMPFY